MKKLVTENALIKRLNRHLVKLDLNLRKCPSKSPWYKSLGNYYLIDIKQNAINGMNVDIAATGETRRRVETFRGNRPLIPLRTTGRRPGWRVRRNPELQCLNVTILRRSTGSLTNTPIRRSSPSPSS